MISDSLLVTLLGLSAAIAWGFSDFLCAKASKNLGPITASLLVNLVGAAGFGILYLVFMHPQLHLTAAGFWYAFGAGMVLTLGSLCFFKSLAIGPVSLVSPIGGAYPLVTTALALFAFHATLSRQQLIGIACIMIGLLLAAEIISNEKIFKRVGAGPAWGLMTALVWGTGFALLAQGIQRLGWQVASLIEFGGVLVLLAVIIPFVRSSEAITFTKLRRLSTNKYIVGAGLIQLLGVIALNNGISVEASSGAIVTAISACYPILTVFLALRSFKENVKLIPLLGGFISIFGVVVLTLG